MGIRPDSKFLKTRHWIALGLNTRTEEKIDLQISQWVLEKMLTIIYHYYSNSGKQNEVSSKK
jgi:hypothetical protein